MKKLVRPFSEILHWPTYRGASFACQDRQPATGTWLSSGRLRGVDTRYLPGLGDVTIFIIKSLVAVIKQAVCCSNTSVNIYQTTLRSVPKTLFAVRTWNQPAWLSAHSWYRQCRKCLSMVLWKIFRNSKVHYRVILSLFFLTPSAYVILL